ncbi:MAG: 7-cyano-7-deazaguanine synthase, partial [Bacillota bacterium]|nr:7-cyano-7-deazaguanine synthase [Bacillota bacterium]
PELLMEVEVREETYIFTERIPGLGGMPYGTAGRALSLFSGGIDSPVATYLMAKRGMEVRLLHFHSFPFTGPLSEKKVEDLAS